MYIILVFYPHDSENRSNYAMCAVNPSRVSTTFSDAALHEVVDNIAPHTASLLEIVTYNVEVSLTFSAPSFLVSYASTGSTICLCRRTHRFADYDKRSELSEVEKIDLSVLSFPLTAIAASPAMGLAQRVLSCPLVASNSNGKRSIFSRSYSTSSRTLEPAQSSF